MPTLKQQFEEARTLIAKRRYHDALDILFEIDHPKAEEWIDKIYDRMEQSLDEKYAPETSSIAVAPLPARPKQAASKPIFAAPKPKLAPTPGESTLGIPLVSGKADLWYQFKKFLMIFLYLAFAYFFFFGRYSVVARSGNPEIMEAIIVGLSGLFAIGAVHTLFTIIMVFGQEFIVYSNGLEHKSFGSVRRWRWNEIKLLKLKNVIHVQTVMHIPVFEWHEFTLYIWVGERRVCKVTQDYNRYLRISDHIINKTNCRLEHL